MRISSYKRLLAVLLMGLVLGTIGQPIEFLTSRIGAIPGPLVVLVVGVGAGLLAHVVLGHFSKKQEESHD